MNKLLGILAGLAALVGLTRTVRAEPAPDPGPGPSPDKRPEDWTTREVMDYILLRARTFGVPPALALAFAKVESSFRVRAKNPSDPSYGLFAVMPILAQDFGYVKDWRNTTPAEVERIFDVNINSEIALRHIRNLFAKYPREKAIQAYNVGVAGYDKGKRALGYMERIEAAYETYVKAYPA